MLDNISLDLIQCYVHAYFIYIMQWEPMIPLAYHLKGMYTPVRQKILSDMFPHFSKEVYSKKENICFLRSSSIPAPYVSHSVENLQERATNATNQIKVFLSLCECNVSLEQRSLGQSN